MDIPAEVFREYDIRGVFAKDLTVDLAYLVGRSFGSELADRGSPQVVVGGDNRPSSPSLADAVARGLQEAGVSVIMVGCVPTPVLYFAALEFETDGGIQITGSHNPSEYNGIKMVRDGAPLYGEMIQNLRRRIVAEDFASGNGTVSRAEILPRYVEEVASRGHVDGPVHMVLDCGNGAGSVIAVEALTAAGVNVDGLYCESDGTFPNHHPDPTIPEYIEDLRTRVVETGADFGVGLDGDGDRIGAVTETGGIVAGDHLLLLLALDVLDQRPGAEVIFDVKCSQALPRMIAAQGGEPVMWKTGHSHIKARMKSGGAPVAGEMSGHICFADEFFGTDDAIYAAARLARLVARSGTPLSEHVARIPKYPSTPEMRLDCPENIKFKLVEDAIGHYGKRCEVIDIDGARAIFERGWLLIRASNTQPMIVVRIEADDDTALAEIHADAESFLGGYDIRLPAPHHNQQHNES